MWTALFDRRRPMPPRADIEDDAEPTEADRSSGWHESSWALASGVEVIELPAAAAAAWFATA
jgi:hypothetical protein